MSKAHGDVNSDAALQNNTHINGAQNVVIVSGGDTNIVGAVVNGGHVATDIGGNLNIASVQDTSASAAHQESSGGGFSISQGGGSASFSTSHGNASGSYAGVNEQSGSMRARTASTSTSRAIPLCTGLTSQATPRRARTASPLAPSRSIM